MCSVQTSPTHRPLSGATVHEVCDVCGNVIERDVYSAVSGPPAPSAEWLGVCGCDFRKWRWRSKTGEAPWELIV